MVELGREGTDVWGRLKLKYQTRPRTTTAPDASKENNSTDHLVAFRNGNLGFGFAIPQHVLAAVSTDHRRSFLRLPHDPQPSANALTADDASTHAGIY